MRRDTTIRRGLICSLVWTMAGVPSTEAKEEKWIAVQSPHFTVVSTAGEKRARRVAVEFERIRAVFLKALPRAEEDPYQPIIIFAVNNEKLLQELLPQYWETKGPRPPAVFLRGADQHFVALRLDLPRESRSQMIYHEYFHSLTAVNLGPVPVWFAEGMAEFWGNTVIRGKTVEMGLPRREYMKYLERRTPMPLEELFAIQDDPHQSEPSRVTLFYAQSWALMHYIVLGDDRDRLRQAVNAYLDLVHQGADAGPAALKAFGNLAQLEKSVKRYLRSRTLKAYRMDAPVKVDEKAFAIRELTPAESLALRGSFLVHSSRSIDALPLLEEALGLDPTSAIAHESMAYLRFLEDDWEEAARWFEKAVELDSESFLSHYYTAVLAEQIEEPESTGRAEKALRQSIQLNPRFAPAYAALARHLVRRQENLDEALQLALKARELEPANPANWLAVGSALLEMDRLDEANAVGERSLSASKTVEERTAAVAFLQNVKEYASYLAGRYQPVLPAADIGGGSDPVRDASGALNLRALTDRLRWVKENTEEVTGQLSAVECGAGQSFDFVIVAGESKYVLGSLGGQSLNIMERGESVQKTFFCGPQNAQVTAQYIPTGDVGKSADGRGSLLSLDFIKP